jgi:hypothetical protein
MRAGAVKVCACLSRWAKAVRTGLLMLVCGTSGPWFPGVWSCGEDSHAPIRSRPAGRDHDLPSGAGLLIQVIERGVACSC